MRNSLFRSRAWLHVLISIVPVILIHASASADCSAPAGLPGQVNLRGAPQKPYFCDGVRWFEMNFIEAGGTGAGSCTPAELGTFANRSGSFRLCNGSDWLRQTTDTLILGSCTTQGELKFDPLTQVLSACDGGILRTAKLPAPAVVYNATGSLQTYSVPPGVTRLTARIWGAGGGGGGGARKGAAGAPRTGGSGGGGAYSVVQFDVTPGETLNLYVGRGGGGGRALLHTFLIIFPSSYTSSGGGGGGLSAIQRASDSSWLVAVGAGGGGGGADEQLTAPATGGRGGAGGVHLGEDGVSATSGSSGGRGATSTSGGGPGTGSFAAAAGAGALRAGGFGAGDSGTRDPASFFNGGSPGLVLDNQIPTGGGGGGGGYGGGGGGAGAQESDVGSSGGGGGSSSTAANVHWLYGESGSGSTPGGIGMADRPFGIAEGGLGKSGGDTGADGGHGLIILIPDPAP
ncbi:MAG: hypothetical protein KF767_16025 [Bdellovibrionaceae bacterium]|nr:hypothetical protein [Pseudobdellovibrionaceae bacterium]